MNILRKIGIVIFALGFLALFINRIADYRSAYLKFALIDFIYEKHLAFLFYVFAAIEAILVVSIFFVNKKSFRLVIDTGLMLYLPFFIAYYIILMNASGGCIECKYTTHFWGEQIRSTGIVLIILTLLYFLLLRPQVSIPENFKS